MASKVLIIFDGKQDSTIDRMARVVATGVRNAGLEAICQTVENARPTDLQAYDGVILGSPCHFAGPSAKMKSLMDSTWGLRGKLCGKAGGAFTASAHIGGGGESALRAIHDFFLIHGMVIQGDTEGDYFGPVAVNPTGDPSEVIVDDDGECHRLGQRVADLAKRLVR
jgi:NAD(P)H dehydrogenase (quinone)